MQAKGWQTSKMQITRMFEKSPLAVSNRIGVEEILTDSICVLFGVNVDSISQELLESIFQAISDRFIGIKVNDIQEAFRTSQIEKKQYVSISRDEVIEPIFTYWRKKQFILSSMKDLEQKEIEENEEILKVETFKNEAIRVFEVSIENKKWLGDPFQAIIIAPDVAINIHARIKKVLWRASEFEYDRNKTQTFFDAENPLNEKRIYAHKIMLYYCKKC